MKLNFAEQFEGVKNVVKQFIDSNPALKYKMKNCSLDFGLASDPDYGEDDYAQETAVFVGDSHLINGVQGFNAEIDRLYKQNPFNVQMKPTFNYEKQKYDMKVSKAGMVQDADVFTPAQLLAPWNIGYFQGIYKKPLSYSHAYDMVKAYTGTKPWAEAMTLFLADYSGFAAMSTAGRPDNSLTQDVGVQSGLMTSSVINMIVNYSLTREEIERAKENESGNPFAGMMVTEKQKYADYVLDMITAYLIYYGNTATGTVGLLNVNVAATYGGTSLYDIAADGSNVTKGATIYNAFSNKLADFLTASDNKFNSVKVAMSPYAFNKLATLVYSDVYNPASAREIMIRNLETDMTKDGRKLKIEWISDPMLKESTIFNSNVYDYLVFSAPEIEAGPGEEKQDLILYGEPIKEFVYPTVPGQQHLQFKKLRKSAGVFAPVAAAVKVYYGFGKDS